MNQRLENKAIVIIGGTSGLGASAARACHAAGARVAIVGRDPAKGDALAGELGDRCLFISGDATNGATASTAIDALVERWARFDGLYHVAGGSGRRWGDGPVHQITDDAWRNTLAWNVDSLFYSNRAAIGRFLELGTGGSIVNMTSVLATRPAPAFFATHAYATAKAASIGLTLGAAACYAPHDIRINAIAPGLVDTPMSTRAVQDADIRDYAAKRQPLDGGRVGLPRDLDGAVVFLLSDESNYITGQVLAVDGGWSVCDSFEPIS